MTDTNKLIEILEDKDSTLGTELLTPVMKSGVKNGIFPKYAGEEKYLENWNGAREMVLAFLKNAEKELS
jgi:hypothetical protein